MTQPMAPDSDGGGRIRILYAAADSIWAQWLAEQAGAAGLEVRAERLEPESDLRFSARIERVAARADTVVLLISRAFVHTVRFPQSEWPAAVEAAAARGVRLVAAIVGTAALPDAAGALPAVDLRAVNADEARIKFLREVGGGDAGPTGPAQSLGRAGQAPVRFPRQAPRFTSRGVPGPQFEWFHGRERELTRMRTELDGTGRVALCGMSSGGKTWLAAEYIRRFRSQYDLIAWVRSGQSTMLREDLGRLAEPLGVEDKVPADKRHTVVAAALSETREHFLLVFDDAVPDGHPRTVEEKMVPGELPARLAELVPSHGNGHVVFTSVSSDWDIASPIHVQPFTEPESAAFLRRHVPDLPAARARDFGEAVDGNPLALNVIAHVLSHGTVTADGFLTLVRTDLAQALEDNPAPDYQPAHSIFLRTMRLLSDAGTDARLAADLVRLLANFAPEPLPIALLTSQMPGTRGVPGDRLPRDLAAALDDLRRRRAVLDYLTQFSLATLTTDHGAGTGQVLTMHRLTRDVLRSQLPRTTAERDAHAAHRILCDADPDEPGRVEFQARYLQLWRQLSPVGALDCPRVADPNDPCARLPRLVRNIVGSLRIKGETTAALALGQAAARVWEPVLGAESISVIQIEIAVSNTLWQLNQAGSALDKVLRLLPTVEPIRDRYPNDYIQTVNLIAACKRTSGDWRGAIAYDEEVHRWSAETLEPDEEAAMRAAHNLAVSLRMLGRFQEALDLDLDVYDRCMENPHLGDRNGLALHSVNNAARDRREMGEYEPAARLQADTVARFLAVFGVPRQQHVLRARKNYAVSLRKAGRYQEALNLARQVRADHEDVYGTAHFEFVAAATNLANDCRMCGLADEALLYAQEAHTASRQLDPRHPFTAACAVNLAAVRREAGEYAQALRLDEEAREILTASLGEDHPYTLAARVDLASDLAGLGRTAEAAALGESTLAQCGRVRGDSHPYTLQCAANLAMDLRALGRMEEADRLEGETLERYRNTLGPEHPEYVGARDRVRGTCDIEPPPM
jgi:tetratricopeptide (TPR) repeat protein